MKTTANEQPAGSERLTVTRWWLRAICFVTTFFSAFFAAHGVLMTGQFLDDEIRPGRIESIAGYTKSGIRLRLENGQEVVFPTAALDDQPRLIELKPGDAIEKRRDSLEYVLNGVPITDTCFVVWNWLLPLRVLVPLTAYLLAGIAYVLMYRSTPLGDRAWSNDSERPSASRRPRTRGGMIIVVLATWLAATIFFTIVFGCFMTCLGGVAKSFRG